VHLNRAGRIQVSGINQLWAADITLLVVLDAFSRKVVGWPLIDP